MDELKATLLSMDWDALRDLQRRIDDQDPAAVTSLLWEVYWEIEDRSPEYLAGLFNTLVHLMGLDNVLAIIDLRWSSLSPHAHSNFHMTKWVLVKRAFPFLERLFWHPDSNLSYQRGLIQTACRKVEGRDAEALWTMIEWDKLHPKPWPGYLRLFLEDSLTRLTPIWDEVQVRLTEETEHG